MIGSSLSATTDSSRAAGERVPGGEARRSAARRRRAPSAGPVRSAGSHANATSHSPSRTAATSPPQSKRRGSTRTCGKRARKRARACVDSRPAPAASNPTRRRPACAAGAARRGVERGVEARDRRARLRHQRGAGRRRRDAAARALEQLDAELELELAERLAERRLGEVQLERGARDAAALGDRDEVAQLADLGHRAAGYRRNRWPARGRSGGTARRGRGDHRPHDHAHARP